MEKSIKTDEINKAAVAVEVEANSVQGMDGDGVDQQGGETYMECRRNYLAPIGRYIVDGCEKFMKRSASEDQTKEALFCARCGCHRSFHRKVMPPPPHVRDNTRFHRIVDFLYSLPLTRLEPRPPAPWPMRSLQQQQLANYELVEGQGSSLSPEEGEEKTDSESGDEVNQAV
ncbi:hypothetical protein Goari_005971 [Gossypium aridum]|uniref:ZF-HD dimerization-type domain-containing protein n=1 Tax=Gossypium aridum TaxID=34290 RepID=A0A7J8XLI0_GOSAI|nr:hypothetical protein [Gossypium aridum]